MEDYKTHTTVLREAAIRCLCANADVGEDCHFADLTFGGGGHSLEILSRSPRYQVVGVDQDPEAWANAHKMIADHSLEERLRVEKMNFGSFSQWVVREHSHIFHMRGGFDGILMDLGVSSHHFDTGERGFSFAKDAPLDMRMASDDGDLETAGDIVNNKSQDLLEKIIREYGEERFAATVARNIVEQRRIRPIGTTKELENIVFHSYPKKLRHGRIHPATRTFQALRIAVNDELGVLSESIPKLYDLLRNKGRLVILSFHSLEDRIVKRGFKGLREEKEATIVTKKPLRADENEIKGNFRARSVKMRVLER